MRANQLFQPAENPAEKIIQTYFYNTLVNFVTKSGSDFSYTRETLPALLKQAITHLISGILDHSYESHGIRLPGFNNITLTRENCPDRYRQLYDALIRLKSREYSAIELQQVIDQIMLLPNFQVLNPSQHLLEMAGLASPAANRARHADSPITTMDIRETFYNLMFAQTEIAVRNEWLAIEKIQGLQHRVWTALPALTILAALHESRNHDGIPLICRKVVTIKNCPNEENFPQLVAAIFSIKDKFLTLREEELHVIRHKLCCKKELPLHLAKFDTPELMQFMAVINRMAISISQSKVFRDMTPEVFSRCCEMLEQETQADTFNPN